MKNIKEFNTVNGIIRFRELENNKDFKKGDTTFLPVGFGFLIQDILEDADGLYCMDGSSRRYVHKSTYEKWDNSLIKDVYFRKIELVNL